MALLDFYEYVVEQAFDGLSSLLARFFCRESRFYACIDVLCSLDLSGLQKPGVSVSLTDENYYIISYIVEGGGAL